MDFKEVRELFPIVHRFLYFDAASLSPYSLPVIDALDKFEKERINAGSLYYDKWYEEIEKGRKLAARLTNAKIAEIALIKNTSEGINLVTLILDWERGDNVVVSDLDFPANIYPFLNLRKKGVKVRYVKSEKGRVFASDIEKKIDKNTKLVSLSHVLYNNGFKIDLEEIGLLCEEKGTCLHVDATQSLGVIETNVKKAKVDFLSVAGYKWLLSPLGSGFFFIKEEFLDHSPILGWRSVKDPFAFDVYNYEILDSARRFEIGNLDVEAFLGMTAALELIDSIGIKKIEKRVIELSSFLLEELNNLNVEVISDFERENRSGIISFIDKNITKKDLVDNSVVATIRDYIRLSPHIYNNEEEILRVIRILKKLGC
jgi:selenocysteine lyase/cysteine desulfurase